MVALTGITNTCRTVPTIGRKPLDLHRLFVEVTRRGGLQKVIEDCKWKDVASVFAFPSTTTSASYLLRKYYISLLQTYEQAYFFQKRLSKLLSKDANKTTAIEDTVEHRIPGQPALRVGCKLKGKSMESLSMDTSSRQISDPRH